MKLSDLARRKHLALYQAMQCLLYVEAAAKERIKLGEH